jgi:lipid II:glycine glycyltransferase (peptidoglycan interpeptide bridge formation enzyme)
MTLSIKQVEKDFWQQESAHFGDLNYRQLWEYGVANAAKVGAQSEHIAIYSNDDLIGLADVRIKKIPFIKTGVAYINGGPLVRKESDLVEKTLGLCLKALIDEYVCRRKLSLRINPLPVRPDWNRLAEAAFLENSFQRTANLRQYRTIIIDIGQPLDVIRKQLHQKWRNCLNNAEKQNMSIVSGTSLELFEKFNGLYAQLRSRKDFDVDQDDAFFIRVQKALDESEKLYISIAEADGVPIAGHVSSMLGDVCVYLLGASNEQALKTNAAYLLQWHTINVAKEKNCRWYDLGGIDPEANPGVYRFKQRMGGQEVVSPGPFGYYPNGFKRVLISGCEKLYRVVRCFRAQRRNAIYKEYRQL